MHQYLLLKRMIREYKTKIPFRCTIYGILLICVNTDFYIPILLKGIGMVFVCYLILRLQASSKHTSFFFGVLLINAQWDEHSLAWLFTMALLLLQADTDSCWLHAWCYARCYTIFISFGCPPDNPVIALALSSSSFHRQTWFGEAMSLIPVYTVGKEEGWGLDSMIWEPVLLILL